MRFFLATSLLVILLTSAATNAQTQMQRLESELSEQEVERQARLHAEEFKQRALKEVEANGGKLPSIPPQVAGMFDPTDPVTEIFSRRIKEQGFDFRPRWEAMATMADKPVVKHLVNSTAKETTMLPTADEIAAAREAFQRRIAATALPPEVIEKAVTTLEEYGAAQAAAALKPRHIPRCQSSDRKRWVLSEIAPDLYQIPAPPKNPKLLDDVLFMRKAAPADADEFFGTKVRIIQITENEGDALSASLSRFGLECLPYRARIFEGYTMALEGREALLNFDRKMAGELHPTVAKNLEEYLR